MVEMVESASDTGMEERKQSKMETLQKDAMGEQKRTACEALLDIEKHAYNVEEMDQGQINSVSYLAERLRKRS